MALRKCKECGHDVSTTADACPNCGAKAAKKTSLLSWLVLIFGIVIIISMITPDRDSGKVGTSGNSSQIKQASASSKPVAPPEARSDKAPVHAAFRVMPEPEKRGSFAILIESAGESCGSVTETFYVGVDEKNSAFWSAKCSSGNAYMVTIKDDAEGSTLVTDCGVLALVGVKCFEKF